MIFVPQSYTIVIILKFRYKVLKQIYTLILHVLRLTNRDQPCLFNLAWAATVFPNQIVTSFIYRRNVTQR